MMTTPGWMKSGVRRNLTLVDAMSSTPDKKWPGGGVITVALIVLIVSFSIAELYWVSTTPDVRRTLANLETDAVNISVYAGCAMDRDGTSVAEDGAYVCVVMTRDGRIFPLRPTDGSASPYLSGVHGEIVHIPGSTDDGPFLSVVAMINKTKISATRGASLTFVTQQTVVVSADGTISSQAKGDEGGASGSPHIPISYVSSSQYASSFGVLLLRYVGRGASVASVAGDFGGMDTTSVVETDDTKASVTTWQFAPLGVRKPVRCSRLVPAFSWYFGSSTPSVAARMEAGDPSLDITCVTMQYSLAGVRFDSSTGPANTVSGTVGVIGGVATVVRVASVAINIAAVAVITMRTNGTSKPASATTTTTTTTTKEDEEKDAPGSKQQQQQQHELCGSWQTTPAPGQEAECALGRHTSLEPLLPFPPPPPPQSPHEGITAQDCNGSTVCESDTVSDDHDESVRAEMTAVEMMDIIVTD
jgi:hypothetical protein